MTKIQKEKVAKRMINYIKKLDRLAKQLNYRIEIYVKDRKEVWGK